MEPSINIPRPQLLQEDTANVRDDTEPDGGCILFIGESGDIRTGYVFEPRCEVVLQLDPLARDADVAALPVCVRGDTCIIRLLLRLVTALFDHLAPPCGRMPARVK